MRTVNFECVYVCVYGWAWGGTCFKKHIGAALGIVAQVHTLRARARARVCVCVCVCVLYVRVPIGTYIGTIRPNPLKVVASDLSSLDTFDLM